MKMRSATKEYEVLFVSDPKEISAVLGNGEYFFVIDQNVFELHRSLFDRIKKDKLYLLRAEEQGKNIDSVISIIEKMLSVGVKRSSTMVSIGGGITQDITGLAASLYFRGIRWLYLPTTLLAQSDSCIGGKTSLNHQNYKNLIGNFFPPDRICIHTDFLRTLPDRDYLSGIGEIVKLFLIKGKEGFEEIKKDMRGLIARDEKVIRDKTAKSLEIKRTYIEEDEFDLGRRGILNFGHTVGHAIESASDYKISHGEAVVLGMDIANHISCGRGLLKKELREDIKKNIFNLTTGGALPEEAKDVKKIILFLKKDKKRVGSDHTFILMDDGFAFKKYNDVQESEVERALQKAIK